MEKGSEGDLEKAKDDCGDADADLGRAISLGPVDVSALEEEISGRERLGNQKITKAGLGNQKNTKAESQDTKNKSENALEIDKSFVWDQESSGSTINDFEIENKDTFVQEKEIYLGESSIEVMPMAESDNSFCQDEGGGFGHDANEIVSGVVSVQSQEKENYPEKSNLDVEASAKDTSAVCQDKENYSQNSTKEDVAQCENALGQDKDNASENTEMEFVTENDNGLDQGKENDPENVVNEVSVENKNTFCQGKENYSESTIQEAVILSGSAIDEDRDNEAENIRMEIDGLDQYKDNYPEHFGHDVAIESENTVHQNKEKDSESTIQEALTQSGSAIDEDRDNEAENTGMEIEKESDNGLDQNKENYPEHSVLDVAIESDNTVHEDKVKDSENTTKEFAREAVDISDDNEDGNSIGGQSDCLILDEMGTSDWEKEEEVSIADGSQSEGNISSCSVDVKCSSHCQEKGSDVTGVQKLDVKGQNVPAINQGGPSTSTKKSQSPSSDQTPVKETNLNSNQGGPSTSTKKSQSPSSDQTPVKETNLNRSGNGEEATVSSNGSKISVKKDKATTVFLTEGNFQKVVLVADPYYEQELRKLETEHVKLVLVKGLKPNNLSTCIKEKKRSFGKKVLWVYVSGILNVTDLKEDCRCYKPLSKVAIDTSFRRSNHTSRFTVFSDINCIVEAQKELGIEGVLAIIPPIPSAVIIKPLMKHSALHELSNKLHAPLAYVNDAELLKKLYEEYCYSWSNMAHSKLSLFSTSPYLDFGKKTYWLNLIFGISENCSMHALRLWRILIRKFFNVVFSTSFPKEKIMAPLIYSGNRYDQIVIICDGKNLDMLQEATKDMPVAYCNQFLDLDRSGVASITSISSKLPDKTLYLVITGFSEIASIDQNAIPNCRKGICSNPLVVYALRNNIESINFDRMLCNIMKSTAEMVIIANKALPQESGLLLCPLVPLRGFFLNSIMIEHHSYLHKEYMKNPDVPMFIGSKCRWNTNANCFEKLWLSLLKGIHANPEVLEKTIEKYNKGIHQFDFASMKEESPSKKEESPSKKEESPLKKEESPSKKESLSSPVLKNWTDMMVELLKYYLSLTENDPILFNIDGAISFMKMILDKKKAAGDPKEEVDPTVLSLMNKACSCSGDIKCNLHQGDEKTINKSASAPDVGTSQMHSMHDETTLQTMTGTTSVEQIVIESLVDSFNPVSKFQRSARLEALKAAKNGFEKIVFLGSNLYKDILKDFEKLDENVILMLANSMKFEDLRSIIHSQKRKIGKKTLWILVSGIWSVAIDEKEPSCDKCSILKATNSFKECQEPVGDMMRLCLTEVNSCMQELQRELGNNGIIILAPPIPTYAIKSSSCHHKTLHEIVDMDPIPLIQREEVEMLKNVYDTFCAFWTKLACLIAQDVIPLVFKFDQFCKNNCGHNFKLISNKPEIKAHSKWKEFMKTIILGLCPTKLESTSGKLSTKLETASLVSTWMFERIVIVGYTEHLGKLQEETKDMPVSFVNENVDLDDSLVAAIQRIKDKWPGTHNILFLIMTSISRLCYFLSDGNPKCAASNCKFRLPSYVMKNKPQGDPFYKTWYGVDMVEDIVELSFCSIARADKSMPKGSRVLLAPLVPVQAFVMDTPYLGTHAEIHKTYEKNPKFPLLMGPYHAWSSCSQNFNNKWLDVIKCIHTHHNFTNIFNYIELRNIMVDCLSPVSTPHQKHVDKRWTKIMISLLRFYTSLKESDPVPFKPFEDTGRRARESKNQGGVTRVTEPSQPSGESVAKFPELVTLSKPTGERVAKPPELVTPSYNPSSAPSLVFNNPETVNNPSSATHLALHPSNDIPSPMSNISCQPPSNNVPPYEPHQFPPPFFSNVPPPSLTPISNVAPPSLTPISNVTPPSLTPISNVPPYTSGMSQPPSYNVPHPSLPPISNVPPCTPVVSQLPLHNVPPYGPNASQTPFSNVSPHTPVMSQPPITIVSHLGPGAAQPPFSNVPPHAPGMSEFPYSSVPLLGPDASQPPFSNVPSHLPDVSHPTFSSIPPYVPSMPPPPLSDPNTFPNNSVSTPSGLPMHQVSAFPQSVVTTPSPVSNFTIPHQSISTTPASGHPIGLSPSTVSLQTTASITSSLEVSPSPVLTESSTTSQVTPKQASVNGRIIVQNIQTELNLSQVKDVLKIFGSLESFNWPGGGERKTGGK